MIFYLAQIEEVTVYAGDRKDIAMCRDKAMPCLYLPTLG